MPQQHLTKFNISYGILATELSPLGKLWKTAEQLSMNRIQM